MNRRFLIESYTGDFSDLDLFFKNVRIWTFYVSGQDYIQMKLCTLLKLYGYRSRSCQLIRCIDSWLDFYQLETNFRENVFCDMKNLKLDDIIILWNKMK